MKVREMKYARTKDVLMTWSQARPDLSIQDITTLLVSLTNLTLSCHLNRLEYVDHTWPLRTAKSNSTQWSAFDFCTYVPDRRSAVARICMPSKRQRTFAAVSRRLDQLVQVRAHVARHPAQRHLDRVQERHRDQDPQVMR